MNLLACNESTSDKTTTSTDSKNENIEQPKKPDVKEPISPPNASKIYSNARFKDVTVKITGENNYTIEGKGQIFEASFSYVVEDGHEELKKGHQMTDAGAPAWGKFSFTVDVPKKIANSTLTLILFEASAKDGSRQHELQISLSDK